MLTDSEAHRQAFMCQNAVLQNVSITEKEHTCT